PSADGSAVAPSAADGAAPAAAKSKPKAKGKKPPAPKAFERNLVLQADRAHEGRLLATLDRNVDLGEFTLERCRFPGIDAKALSARFRPLGLRVLEHLVHRLEQERPDLVAATATATTTAAAAAHGTARAPAGPARPARPTGDVLEDADQDAQDAQDAQGEPVPAGFAEDAESTAESTAESAAQSAGASAPTGRTAARSAAGSPEPIQGNLFEQAPAAVAAALPPAALPFKVHIVETPEQLADLVKALRAVPYFAWDTETTSEQPMLADPVGISLCWSDAEAWYIALHCGPAAGLETPAVLKALAPIFTDPAVRKVAQNGKYDLKVLRRAGLEVKGQYFDTMVAAFLLEPGRGGYGIDALSEKYLHYTKIPTTALIGSGKSQTTMDRLPVRQVAEYSCEDAWATWRLAGILETRLREEDLWEIYSTVEQPLVETLAAMEYEGIILDAQVLKVKGEEVRKDLVTLGEEIHRLAGRDFNIDSPNQLAEILFTQLQLPILRKSPKTHAPSTDEGVLKALAKQHPLPAKVLEYRTLAKLLGTYIEALPKSILPTTGRIHASFLQTGAATGRLASWNPNLQNIPVRREQGAAIRAAFKPRTGWKFLACDYSQIELRLLAHYAEDETLREAFRQGEDIHRAVAARVFHVPLEAVTDELRGRAKAVNFGILYGQGAHGLAENLGIKRGEAKEIIDEFFARHPGVAACREKILNEARANGYVTTLKGRKRYIPEVHAPGYSERGAGERMAVNTVFQGSAADLVKEAMNAIHRKLFAPSGGFRARMLLQIHDELLFESPPEELERLTAMVVATMEGVEKLNVPLKVSVAVGNDWSEV
ncbi:MAG: DNA polymerase, partial [Planctomycetota bacterium]